MKSALLFTAMLSGLCAEVMASPFGSINYQPPAAPLIERDLHFNAGPVDEAFQDDFQQELVTTEFDQLPIDDDLFSTGGSQAAGPLGVPEPPPVMLILTGLSSLGFFALGRRASRKRRRSRRRTVARIRALTAER